MSLPKIYMVSLKYLGHSAFEAQFGNKTVLFDPWLDLRPKEERLIPPAHTAEEIRSADLILISHEHFDHFDPADVKRIYERTFAHIVAPEPVFERLSLPENRKVVAYVGDEFSYQGFDIRVVEARHPQSSYPVGYIVSDGSQSIYFAGDTYDFYGLSKIKADIALLPIGGTYTMDIIGALSALQKMRVSHVIPMHYGTFSNIRADPHEFRKKAKMDSKAQVHVLDLGESIEL
ncbi:MAG: MBL fold metallo-hydrolase [Candidatus Micrarchaeota archaeon]